MSHSNPKGILLCDYDMFLVYPSFYAQQSLLWAARAIAPNEQRANGLVIVNTDGSLEVTAEMRNILRETSGTTEQFLVAKLAKHYGLKRRRRMQEIRDVFYQARLNYYISRRDLDPELARDEILPYVLDFLRYCKKLGFVLIRCTGNPRRLMEVREPPELAELFDGGAYGNKASNRRQMIKRGIERALEMYPDLEIRRDRLGYPLNIVYGADSDRDIMAAISAGVRMISAPCCGPELDIPISATHLFDRIYKIAKGMGLGPNEIERLISPVEVTLAYNAQYLDWLEVHYGALGLAGYDEHVRMVQEMKMSDRFIPAPMMVASHLGCYSLWKNMAALVGERLEFGIEARRQLPNINSGVDLHECSISHEIL